MSRPGRDGGGTPPPPVSEPSEHERRASRLREQLHRSRWTPGLWGIAVVWFLVMGWVTSNPVPALAMAALAGLASWGTARLRRRRLRELERLDAATAAEGAETEQD